MTVSPTIRLYQIIDTAASGPSSHRVVPGSYFSNKASAKTKRQELNNGQGLRFVVSPGPDHRRYKGDK
jgi:hypothetical protein